MKAIVVAACILTAALGGCRASTPPNDEAGGPTASQRSGSPSPSFSPGEPAQSLSPGSGLPSNGPTPAASAGPFVTIGSSDDPRGDAGTDARDYNDLIGVRIQDNGPRARILVRLGGDVPRRMPDGEQMGIGVDFYEQATADESTFQIFAAGTSEGWQAFFETPNGFIEYPGSFGLGDDILQFEIPWSAFDDLRGSRFVTFLDWDREALAVGIAGQDRAPDGTARARFSR